VARELDTTVALIRSHSRPFGLVNPTEYSAENNPDPTHFQRAYDVRSEVLTVDLGGLLDHRVGSASWSKDVWDHYLAAPTDPRYAKLAEECLKLIRPSLRKEPLARAVAVKIWLEQNGTYDLTSKYENSADPVGDFLFGDRVGYCVSFAHAACAMFRTVGVPARVATGYAVDARFKGASSAILIRSNAAHAWPEIYLDGVGWVVMDIAPAKSLVKPSDPPDSSQQDLYGDLARQKNKRKMPDRQPVANGNMQQLIRDLLRGLMWGLLYGVVGVFVGLYGVKIYRRAVVGWAGAADVGRVAYRAALDALADGGRVRPYGQSREDFARSLAEVSPAFVRLTALHLRQALGSPDRRPGGDEIRRLYAEAGREIARSSGPGRRVMAVLNPFGWLRVK
jgi:hypothetical protein